MTQTPKQKLFGRFDAGLIGLSMGTAVAVVSPAEIENVLGWPDSFFRFLALLILSLALAAMGLVRGLFILGFRRQQPFRARAMLAIIYLLTAAFAYELSPVAGHVTVIRAEHAWNWVRSLTLRPVTRIDAPSECQKVYGREAVILTTRLWSDGAGGECESKVIQYDSPNDPVCSAVLGTDPRQETPAPDFSPHFWSGHEIDVAHSLTSVVSCTIP